LLAVACVAAATSCSVPGKGALVLAISTDMQAPKDIDVVSVFVSTNSVPKFDYIGRVTPEGKVILPATLAIEEADDPNTQVRVRIIAFRGTQPRVLRDVLTTVPHQRSVLLRLPLDFLDVGSVQSGSLPQKYLPDEHTVNDGPTAWDPTDTTDIVPTCDLTKGLTMVHGVCVDDSVDSSLLPEYSGSAVFGDGGLQSSGLPAQCFDVASCFALAAPVAGLDTKACAFPLPAGAPSSTLNVALVTPDTGTCLAPGQCYVPLPNDPSSGWVIKGAMVQLAPGVCARLASPPIGLVVSSGTCSSETISEPVCEVAVADAAVTSGSEPAEDAPQGPSTPETGTDAQGMEASDASEDAAQDVVDAGAAPVDATFDATVTDAGPDATVDAGSDVQVTPGDASPEAQGCSGTLCGDASCVDTSTDPANCGGCGVVCQGTCAVGRCQVTLFVENDVPNSVAIDANNVYWTDTGNNAVLKVAKTGGPVTTLASVSGYVGAPIAVDATRVYYLAGAANAVMGVPIAGGSPVTISSHYADTFVSDGANLYWASKTSCPGDGGPCDGVVASQPLDGGAQVTLATGTFTPVSLAVDGTSVYVASQGTSPTFGDGAILKVPLDGGAPATLASAQIDPTTLVVDAANVYWTNGALGTNSMVVGGSVVQVPIAGGSPTTLASNLPEPSGICVDGTNVYYTALNGGASGWVASVPLDGGTPTNLTVSAGSWAYTLAVDATNAYWAAGGSIWRMPKVGGQPTALHAGISNADSVAVAGGTVYATYATGSLLALPANGGAPATLATNLGQPEGLAVNSQGVYWSDWTKDVMSMPLDGGVSTTLAIGTLAPVVVVDGANVYWWDSSTSSVQKVSLGGGSVVTLATGLRSDTLRGGIALDANNVYLVLGGTLAGNYADGTLVSVPIQGGTPNTLVSGRSSPAAVAVVSGSVYWGESTGAVMTVPAGGGSVSTLATGGAGGGVESVVADTNSLYWTTSYSILKAPLDGGSVVTLVPQTSTGPLGGLALDSNSVYWANQNTGAVMKVTPK
jgi:hypothetical protein